MGYQKNNMYQIKNDMSGFLNSGLQRKYSSGVEAD